MDMLKTLGMTILSAIAASPVLALSPATPAAALAGRIARTPVECIGGLESDSGGAIYDSGDILYRGRGSRLYVNHPDDCSFLRSNRVIVSRIPTGRQCRGDIIEVRDQVSPIAYGSCTLGAFTPYDRPRK